MVESVGRVYLVGAGPGDPGLITLRGIQCLAAADVVMYDYLVNPRILRHVRADAQQICLGRHSEGRLWSQEEIIQRLLELARTGQSVVRLKGGDPAVFARGAEELEALAAAEIPFEVVPGVTAALAASSYAGIPITHRELASAVALITGQEHAEKNDSALDFGALAAFPGTLVFYMGVTTAEQWTTSLIAAGKSPTTPAAILRRCSLPDQRLVHCDLAEVPQRLLGPDRIRPPAIVIVGEVVQLSATLSWFDRRPLFGQTVLVTRPHQQGEKLAELLEEQGAQVRLQPAIEIRGTSHWEPVDASLQELGEYDWLVFTSVNGVRFFMERLFSHSRDARALGGLRIASVGPGTTAALAEYSLRADLEPPVARAESLADALRDQAAGHRFLIPRASRGRDLLADELTAAGGSVRQIVVYESVNVSAADPDIVESLQRGEVDWVTVTSSATAGALHELFGEALRSTRLASISPITSAALRELQLEPAIEAEQHTMAGLRDAIVAAD